MSEQIEGVLDSSAGIRANVFYGLARALEPPRKWDTDLPDLLADSLGAEISDLAAKILENRELAEIAHAKLFLGPFEILVAPWASFYLEEEPQLMGSTSYYAARAYAEAGLAPGQKLKDVPDQVTHELEFMYFLAFNEATTGEREWSERQERFWCEHLGCWLPQFAETLQQAAVHPFYCTLAETIAGVCATENAALGDPTPVSSCKAETQN